MTRPSTTTPDDAPIQSPRHSAGVSGWLSKIIYPLGQYVVLPGYFREIEIIGKQYIPYTGAVIIELDGMRSWFLMYLAPMSRVEI